MLIALLLGLLAFSDAFLAPSLPHSLWKLSSRYLAMQAPAIDLSQVGVDIEIPRADKITKIVMKFGGSSLANAERVTYVARLIQKHVESG